MGHKDLRFGQIVYILVFYNISFSWLLPLDGFRCIFLCRVYCVTVKMKNSIPREAVGFLCRFDLKMGIDFTEGVITTRSNRMKFRLR